MPRLVNGLVGVGCLVVCAWLITRGTFEFFVADRLGAFYDAQADSLLHGHWDVPMPAIESEAFVVEGKAYGYFGFVPALPRMVLNAIFPYMPGRWTRFLMLVEIALVMGAVWALSESAAFVMVAMLGGIPVFLASFPVVYHEAIAMGLAGALWSFYFFRRGWLWAALACAFVGLNSRATLGAGPLIAGAMVAVRLGGRRAVLVVAAVVGIAGSFVAANYAKFGTLVTPPYEKNVLYDAGRVRGLDARFVSVANVPVGVDAYFNPLGMSVGRRFPWFAMRTVGREGNVEPTAGMPAAMPALMVLAIVGLWRSRERWLALSALAGALPTLAFHYISYRYEADFFPFLVVAGAAGLALAGRWRVVVGVLMAWSVAANLAFAYTWSRTGFWPDAASMEAWQDTRDRVDAWFDGGAPGTVEYRIGDRVHSARAGQVLRVVDRPGTAYRYDGQRWVLAAGSPMHRLQMAVRFQEGAAGQEMPLWSAGEDVAYVLYSGAGRVSVCFEHGQAGGQCGESFEAAGERVVVFDADRLNRRVAATVDGRAVLETASALDRWNDGDVKFGMAKRHGDRFAGVITPR